MLNTQVDCVRVAAVSAKHLLTSTGNSSPKDDEVTVPRRGNGTTTRGYYQSCKGGFPNVRAQISGFLKSALARLMRSSPIIDSLALNGESLALTEKQRVQSDLNVNNLVICIFGAARCSGGLVVW